MKAPDKIYLASEYVDNKTLPVGVTKKQVFEKDVCYIRKNALLEWLKQRREALKVNASGIWSATAAGKYIDCVDIIDKIESL